ncbi:gamma-parvin isoform X2 [Phycodurus eques]|uniref:gamma-parvin isoform X2 n=1 Tax=Phycodurus eques TaxID=693459 RepID=UPI002ACD9606|nr:gamma-parvin isoform X2 [Phycodurus eques]
MEADVSQNHNEEEEEEPVDADCFQVVRTKMIQPTSRKDPKVEKLTEALLDWINSTLKTEHIVVQSLDEDLYDGLVLHHLLARLAGVRLSLEEIALTSSAQIRKLEAVMEELDKRLDQSDTKWDVSRIHNKDLLATLHLLVAMVRRKGMRSDVQTEVLTGDSTNVENLSCTDGGVNAVEQLLKLGAHKVAVVKQALVDFVNKSLASLGLHVSDVDKQFSDGVILLLLIGQLEGFFIPLCDFSLIPVNNEQMLHNVTFALSLLTHAGLHVSSVQPQDFVAREVAATLKVLYALFCKHARQEEKTSVVFL